MALPASIAGIMAAASQKANAERLAANPDTLVNGNAQGDIDSGLYAGDTTGAQFDTSRGLAADTGLESTPQVQELSRMADFGRRNAFDNQQQADTDLLNGGAMARAMGKANIDNQVGDTLSEGAAGRTMLPNASAVAAKQAAAKQAAMSMEYLQPVAMRNQNNLDLEGMREASAAAGQGAKTAGEPDKAYLNTIMSLIAAQGKGKGGGLDLSALTPDVLAKMHSLFSLAPPTPAPTAPVPAIR